MDTIFRVIVYLASAWVSTEYAAGYWVVGPVFGMAVISYDSNSFRKLIIGKHFAFLATSSLIYALVCWLSTGKWEWSNEVLNYFFGPLALGVVVGSVLLPIAHGMIFKKSAIIVRRAILWLIGTFYLVMLATVLNDQLSMRLRINFLGVAIFVWQGVYLYLLARERSSTSR